MGAEIAWERFRPLLGQVYEKERKCPAGRKPFDVLLMFKVLILNTLNNRADEAVEYQIRDRVAFIPFLGLEMYGSVPDGTNVWRFRERLKALALIERLFDRFDDYLAQAGSEARNGQIIDASIVPVPIQRNTREENRRIKAGEEPEDWSEPKRRQKDTDGRWTKKHGKNRFGDNNHTRSHVEHVFGFQQNSMGGKLIRTIGKAPAEVKIGLHELDLQPHALPAAHETQGGCARARLKNGRSGRNGRFGSVGAPNTAGFRHKPARFAAHSSIWWPDRDASAASARPEHR